MNIPLTEAKARLTDLVRRAEAGEEVVLTRHGQPAARIVRVTPRPPPDVEERLALIDRLVAEARRTRRPGPDAAHAADFLYDEDGLPG